MANRRSVTMDEAVEEVEYVPKGCERRSVTVMDDEVEAFEYETKGPQRRSVRRSAVEDGVTDRQPPTPDL